MTRSELLALPLGARVSLKNGKVYQVRETASPLSPNASPEWAAENPDGFNPPVFQQWRSGEAKFPAGRLYGPAFVRLKAANVTRIPSPVEEAPAQVVEAPAVEAPADVVTVTITRAAALVAGWDDRSLDRGDGADVHASRRRPVRSPRDAVCTPPTSWATTPTPTTWGTGSPRSPAARRASRPRRSAPPSPPRPTHGPPP